jgi:hypothetical protein
MAYRLAVTEENGPLKALCNISHKMLIFACVLFVSVELLVIVEYCRFGNLHNYLLRHREDFVDQIDPKTGQIDTTIGVELLSRHDSVLSKSK